MKRDPFEAASDWARRIRQSADPQPREMVEALSHIEALMDATLFAVQKAAIAASELEKFRGIRVEYDHQKQLNVRVIQNISLKLQELAELPAHKRSAEVPIQQAIELVCVMMELHRTRIQHLALQVELAHKALASLQHPAPLLSPDGVALEGP